jgi:regulator of nucleoside diphosphate kinase
LKESIMNDRLPPITLIFNDFQRLQRLAHAAATQAPRTADYLAREVDRARILQPHESARGFVRMGSRVDFRDNDTGQVCRIILVYPDQADITVGKISVLTPIGAALIGLSQGQTISWQNMAADCRSLTVLAVDLADAVGKCPEAHLDRCSFSVVSPA